MGWWSATPKKAKKSRWQSNGGATLPPVQMESLCRWLADLGYADSGMDLSPLKFAEIKAWAEVSACPVTPWIIETLRKGSEAFVKGYHEGRKASSTPPWSDREAAQAQASQRIAASLSAIKSGAGASELNPIKPDRP